VELLVMLLKAVGIQLADIPTSSADRKGARERGQAIAPGRKMPCRSWRGI
jgi:hypothetical protein